MSRGRARQPGAWLRHGGACQPGPWAAPSGPGLSPRPPCPPADVAQPPPIPGRGSPVLTGLSPVGGCPPPVGGGAPPTGSGSPPDLPHLPPDGTYLPLFGTQAPGSPPSRTTNIGLRMAPMHASPPPIGARPEAHRLARGSCLACARTCQGHGRLAMTGTSLRLAGAPLPVGGAPHSGACGGLRTLAQKLCRTPNIVPVCARPAAGVPPAAPLLTDTARLPLLSRRASEA